MARIVIFGEADFTNCYKYNFQEGISGYTIDIVLSQDDNLDDLLTNTYDLDQSIDFCINVARDMRNSSEDIKQLEDYRHNVDQLVKNSDYIFFDVDLDDYKKFIQDSKLLKTKKILFYETEDLGLEKLERIKQIFINTNNIYFSLKGNYDYVTFDECYKTYETLEKVIGHINKLNLSPFEKIIYAYDFAKDKVYKKEAEGSSYGISRSISSVLFGEDIVCVGFARRFEYILNGLGIENEEVVLYKKEEAGHMINLVHVIDEKYDIDGYYYFDATWDSPNNHNRVIYPNTYKYFAKTREKIEKNHGNKFNCPSFPYFDGGMPYEFEKIMEEEGMKGISEDLRKSINYLLSKGNSGLSLSLMYFYKLSPNYGKIPTKEIVEELEDIIFKFEDEISAETFIQALYNVRKYQYYENPETLSFDLDKLLIAYLCSDFEFNYDIEEKILKMELEEEEFIKFKKAKFFKFCGENNLDRDMQGIKLAKVLRKVYEEKRKNNS